MQQDVGVVEDHLNAGVNHQVCHVLGGGRWGGDDADDLVGLCHAFLEFVYVFYDDVADGPPGLVRVVVEDVVDHEPALGEYGAGGDGATEVAGPDERDVVGLLQAENAPDGLDEVVGLVADPTGAREPYGVQISPHLYGVYARVVP